MIAFLFHNISANSAPSIDTEFQFLKNQVRLVKAGYPQDFLAAIGKLKDNTMELNKQAIGLRSTTLDNAAVKIKEIADTIGNWFKLAKSLLEKSDRIDLTNKLKIRDLNDQLNDIRKSINKSFATEKRKQARDYQIKIIDILKELAKDAITMSS